MAHLVLDEGKWIEWIDVDCKNNDVFLLDEILKPTNDLWNNLTYNCTPDCCAIMAYSFKGGDIWSASLNLNIKKLIGDFKEILKKLSEIEETVVESKMINQVFEKSVFENIINHIVLTLSEFENQ